MEWWQTMLFRSGSRIQCGSADEAHRPQPRLIGERSLSFVAIRTVLHVAHQEYDQIVNQ